jgi:hypothetical protein
MSADTVGMSAIGAAVILVAGCAALWRFARWDAKGQRARRDNRQADLDVLQRHGIEPPSTAAARGMWKLVVGGPITVLLVVVAPSWAKVLVVVVSAVLLCALVWQDQKAHNLARRRAMETADAPGGAPAICWCHGAGLARRADARHASASSERS